MSEPSLHQRRPLHPWVRPKKDDYSCPSSQLHNYPKLMSGTCHLQCGSKSELLRVIARLALECIWADRIDGGKTQGSVIGDTALLIYQLRVLWPPWIKICWWNLKMAGWKTEREKAKGGRGRKSGNVRTDIKRSFKSWKWACKRRGD